MNFKELEEKWKKEWKKRPDLYKAYDGEEEFEKAKGFKSKGKKYILVEFPYPSGTGLHIGHAFSFTAADVYARFYRMQGYNVLCPMGWDAFGLPTENHAIKTKQRPQAVTEKNCAKFKEQMQDLAMSFDWQRELNTTDANYYKWTQWIFIQLWKKGLAQKQKMNINWCPSCKIGLANEEVVDGKCERCGAKTERREMGQWVFKITEYAEKLLSGLEKTNFIDKVKASQINWIGKKEGAKIRFELEQNRQGKKLEVFTTRPDTIYGVSALVVAPEHELVAGLLDKPEIRKYVEEIKNKSDLERTDLNKDKSGVFSGLWAINPINQEKVPIWIADYVLAGFGTGAIMLVPGHDKRDWEFAKKYRLEVKMVVKDAGKTEQQLNELQPMEEEGVAINSELIDGLTTSRAKEKIITWLEENNIGQRETTYHLRDWIFSRQHYWGEPIPMWKKEGSEDWGPVEEKDLPVKLPEVEAYEPTETGESPLAKIKEFVEVKDETGVIIGQRETDTMPNWGGSDWYFVGYLMPQVWKNFCGQLESDRESVFVENLDKQKYWLPVDVYIGGDEHNTLHLLYSRFIMNFLYDMGVVSVPEPYDKRVSHGVILGPDGSRMSKSRGNVIVPEDYSQKYGVDVLRTYMMFMGPFEATMAWNEKTLVGVARFLNKMEKMMEQKLSKGGETGAKEASWINKTIEDISRDLAQFKFNTPVAKLMELVNNLQKEEMIVNRQDLGKILAMLAVYAPYLAEELWVKLNLSTDSVHQSPWPLADASKIVNDILVVPVCINGKIRGEIKLAVEEVDQEEEIKRKAMEAEAVFKYLAGREVKRAVYVPGKMINLVV